MVNTINQDSLLWLNRQPTQIARFSFLGLDADIASLSMMELWALFLHLSRLMEG